MNLREKCPLCGFKGEFMQMKSIKPREDEEIDFSQAFGQARWQACPMCHFVFQIYEMNEEDVLKYYQEDYRLDRNKHYPHINDYRVEGTRAWAQHRWILMELKVNRFIKSVLDIGCNLGGFIEYAITELGVTEYMGVEPNRLAHVVLESKGIPFVPTIYDLDDTQYDLINVSHVLEHFMYPMKTLRDELYPRVKPGKYIMIEVPNMEKSNAWCSSHISAFNPVTLAHMVTKAGFYVTNNRFHPENNNLMLFAKRPM